MLRCGAQASVGSLTGRRLVQLGTVKKDVIVRVPLCSVQLVMI